MISDAPSAGGRCVMKSVPGARPMRRNVTSLRSGQKKPYCAKVGWKIDLLVNCQDFSCSYNVAIFRGSLIQMPAGVFNKPYPVYEVNFKPIQMLEPKLYFFLFVKKAFLQVITILRCLYLKQTFDAKWKKLRELEPHEEARKKNGKWVFKNKTLLFSRRWVYMYFDMLLRFREYISLTCWDAKMSTSQVYPTIYSSFTNHSTCYPKCYIHHLFASGLQISKTKKIVFASKTWLVLRVFKEDLWIFCFTNVL